MPLIHSIEHPGIDGIRVGKINAKGHYRPTGSCIIYRLGNTVIDTGPSKEWPTVRDFFIDKSINRALITHYHEDHSGNGQQLQQQGLSIHSHHCGHQKLELGFALSFIRRKTFGSVNAFSAESLPEQITTDNGHTLQSLHMPGHSEDMTCFYEANEGWLFSGDLYIASQVKYMMSEEDVGALINSLQRALELDFDTLLCAHRGVIEGGKKQLAKKLDALHSLRQQVADLHQQGLPAKQIRLKLLGREDLTYWLSSFQMSKQHLVDSCLRSL